MHKLHNVSSIWMKVSTIDFVPNKKKYSQTVWELKAASSYRFRVDVHGSDKGAIMDAVAGFATEWIHTRCQGDSRFTFVCCRERGV